MNLLRNREFIWFVVKFLLIFLACYYGSIAIIGLSAEHGYYSSFIEKYFNLIGWLRSSLLHGTRFLLSLFGVKTYFASEFNLRMVNGRGIILGYECVGYGVMSFWAAFVGASVSSFPKKIMWLFIGFIALWVLNIVRLALLLLATNKGWPVPFGWDHHTWFNILAYIFIFTMIYLFHKNSNGPEAGAIGDKHV